MMGNGNEQISSNHDSTTGETQNENDNIINPTDSTYSTADGYGSETEANANANDDVLDVQSDNTLTGEGVTHMTTKKSASKTQFANFSKVEGTLLGLTILFIPAFAASLSFLLLEGYPNKLYSGISLAIFGTAMVVTALVFCCYPSKLKGSEPSSELGESKVSEDMKEKAL